MDMPSRKKTQPAVMLRAELRDVPPDSVVVVCIGNPLRGDDGFGPAVAQALAGKLRLEVLDSGLTPENDLPRVARLRPAAVLLVDAVHFGGRPGTLRLLKPETLRADGISTHSGSLSLVAEFLSGECGARVLVLAAQPGQVCYREGLSPEMERAARRAAALLTRLLRKRKPSRSA